MPTRSAPATTLPRISKLDAASIGKKNLFLCSVYHHFNIPNNLKASEQQKDHFELTELSSVAQFIWLITVFTEAQL